MKKKKIRLFRLISIIPILLWIVVWFSYGVSLPNHVRPEVDSWVNIYIIMSVLMPFIYFMNKIKSKSWLWVLVGALFIVISMLFGKIAWIFISVGLCFMWYELWSVLVRKAVKMAELEYVRGGR